MMKFETFPFFRKNDSLVQLADFLSKVHENNWVWSVLDFYGIGNAPNSQPMEDFEDLVRSRPKGVIMTWHDMKDFANSLTQTYDCLIVAAKSLQLIPSDKLAKENFSDCELIIEAFDRTEWSVWARDKALMQNVKSAY